MGRVKKELKERGANGYHGLQRKFRIMDDDGSHSLNQSEFKKAMKEMNFDDITDRELATMYSYFDKDRNGSISFEEFIQGVRDPLNARRQNMIDQAFRSLDAEGNGFVTAQHLKDIYSVDQHPDFISGKKTRFECIQDFLQVFEVGGEVDGKVTAEEFTNYYHNLSASIDDDDYFELMIRNAWHIMGGKGAAANSANTRVLVTKKDGTQEVVAIQNDLGMVHKDGDESIRRLNAQGYKGADHVSFGGELPEKVKPTRRSASVGKALELERLAAEARNNPDISFNSRPSRVSEAAGRKIDVFGSSIGGLLNNSVSEEVLAPPPAPIQTQIFSSEHHSAIGRDNVDVSSVMPYGISNLVRQMQVQLKDHGAHGFHGLQRKFRIMDDDGNGTLSLGEFKKGVKELALEFTDGELRRLFDHFDSRRTGFIDFEEFLQALRPTLNERRKAMIKLAFDALDSDKSGVLDPAELMEKYDASQHPDVLSGKKTETQALREWMTVFEVGGEIDGKVTSDEFQRYYHNLSASIDNDDYFELMIRNAWHISGGTGAAANSANRRVLVTKDDGSQEVQEIRNDLGIKYNDKKALTQAVRKQDAHAATINLFGSFNDPVEQQPSAGSVQPKGINGRKYVQPKVHAYAASLSSTANAAVLAGVDPPPPPPLAIESPGTKKKNKPLALAAAVQNKGRAVTRILAELRAELASRGARGIVGLSRRFKSMDDNGDGQLSKEEFKKALAECTISLSNEEFLAVFAKFDQDSSGGIDFEEFLTTIRGAMNDTRLRLVEMAFNRLDKDKSGILNPDEMMERYDASKHPDVLAGKKSKTEVLKEFLETFEVGGEIDGKVTKQEFVNYYTNISASVDDDEYFELMIRNAWRISGGEGAAANSANTRVLVTAQDGSQSVATIENDLGLKRGDREETMKRLKEQHKGKMGMHVSSISFSDGGDDGIGGSSKPPVRSRPQSLSTKTSSDFMLSGDYDASTAGGKPRTQQRFNHKAAGSSISF